MNYRRFIFHQALIISTEGGHKHEAMNSLKTVHPLLPLRSLAANIKHMVIQLSEFEKSLCDASGSKARSKNILIIWKVVFGEKTIDVGIIAFRDLLASSFIGL